MADKVILWRHEMKWNKMPSVRSGGKQWFYVTFTDKGKLTVVWHRLEQKWLLIGDLTSKEELYKLFNTSKAAIKHAEAL